MISDAKKKSNYKWNSENMKSVTCYIRRDIAEEFKRLCQANGESMYSVLKRMIEEYIEMNRPLR